MGPTNGTNPQPRLKLMLDIFAALVAWGYMQTNTHMMRCNDDRHNSNLINLRSNRLRACSDNPMHNNHVTMRGTNMKSFQIEEYCGKLHITADGWTSIADKDGCRRELNKWLDDCNQD